MVSLITDVFEYFLLQSGRLVLHVSSERRAVILDNVPFITWKAKVLSRLLGTLQVALHSEAGGGPPSSEGEAEKAETLA